MVLCVQGVGHRSQGRQASRVSFMKKSQGQTTGVGSKWSRIKALECMAEVEVTGVWVVKHMNHIKQCA